MAKRDSQILFTLTEYQQELRQLEREQYHLLQKEQERSLNEWEKTRINTIPEEMKKTERTLIHLSGALQAVHPSSIREERYYAMNEML